MKANPFKALLLAGIALTCGAQQTFAKQFFVPFWQTPTPSTILPLKASKAKGDYHVNVTLEWEGCGARYEPTDSTFDNWRHISQDFYGPVYSKVEILDLSQIVHDNNFDWVKGYYPFVNLWNKCGGTLGEHDYTESENYWNANSSSFYSTSYIPGVIPQEIPSNANVEVNSSEPLYVFGIWVEERWISYNGGVYQFESRTPPRVVCQPVSLAGLPNNSVNITFRSPFGPLDCEEEY